MKLGFIGAGNMASAIARGVGEPVLVSDVDAPKAEALAAATGGQALASNADVAEQADVVLLCHKPYQLADVAKDVAPQAKAIASILGGTPLTALELAYPDRPVYRFMPNIPAEVRQGIFLYAPGANAEDGPEQELLGLLERAGSVVALPEHLIDAGMALMGCGPGLYALFVEAFLDAGVRHGLTPDVAARLATLTMGGSAAVIAENGYDPVALRRRVSSPGGSTAVAVEALEQGGLRAAVYDAVANVVALSR
jgi:pyrroline-5-carboxylate reductase